MQVTLLTFGSLSATLPSHHLQVHPKAQLEIIWSDRSGEHHFCSLRAKGSLTLGTPTKMALFRADSRMRAALATASFTLRRVSALAGSDLVINLYRCPTEDGRLAVSKVHICQVAMRSRQERLGPRDLSRTVRTSHPVSAFLLCASARVFVKIAFRFESGGLGCECGCRKVSNCLIAGGRVLTMIKVGELCRVSQIVSQFPE